MIQACEKLGLKFDLLLRPRSKEGAIEQSRAFFSKVIFNKTMCKRGIDCLREYHRRYNAPMQSLMGPAHNWASHGADAFQYMAQSVKSMNESSGMRIINDVVNTGSIY